MMTTLRGKPTPEAERIITGAAWHLLTHPFPDPTETPTPEERALLKEAVESLNLNDITDADTQREVLLLLEGLLEDYRPAKPDWDAARTRLGTKGWLRPTQYKIVVAKDKNFEERRIRSSHIESAIKGADRTEHLLPHVMGGDETPRFSVFSQFRDKDTRDPYQLLVVCSRSGDRLSAFDAWRVYQSEVPAAWTGSSPLDALRAFVDVYGVSFSVADGPESKFMLYEARLVTGPTQNVIKGSMNELSVGDVAVGTLQLWYSRLNVLEVAMAYQINLSKYLRDLARHV